MIKKEILELIEYKKKLNDSNFENKNRYHDEDILDLEIPNIPDIKDSLNLLQEELEELKARKQNALDYVKAKKEQIKLIHCTHPLIYKYQGGGFESPSTPNKCILCGQILKKEELNKLENKIEIKDDFADEESVIKNYNFNYLYPILIQILDKYNDNDEVDLNREFLELYNQNIIGEMKINGKEYKRKYKILVLGGSNEISINENVFINIHSYNNVLMILKHLEFIQRTNLEILIPYNLEYKRFEYCTKKFKTLKDFSSLLKEKSKEQYDLIIDATTPFDYEINNDKIIITYPKINLEELFPNTNIIHVNDFEKIDFSNEICQYDNNQSLPKDMKKLLLKR